MVSCSWISLFLIALAVAQVQASSAYPPTHRIPPTNSSQVQAWLKDIDLSGAPNITVNTLSGDSKISGTLPKFVPNCPMNQTDADITLTCNTACNSNCTADDITTSATPNTFGLTYEFGPSSSTPVLLNFLKKQGLNATFFLLGSNVIQYSSTIKLQVSEGHHIASNTWSYQPLTTLTNEQIVAEMKWTEKAVLNVTGLKLKYVRPPFGDIDNRVRFVLKQLGYLVVDWTPTFDTNDLTDDEEQASTSASNFKKSMTAYGNGNNTKGFYALEHDSTDLSVAIASKIIKIALQTNLTLESVASCESDSYPYQAVNATTNGTATASGTPTSTLSNMTSVSATTFTVLSTAGATTTPTLSSSVSVAQSSSSAARFGGLGLTLAASIVISCILFI